MHNHHRKTSPLALGSIASGLAKATVALSCLLTATAGVAQTVLEEVLVTSTKRGPSSLMDIPISVNVVTGDDLKFREIRGPLDLRTAVSGLQIDFGAGTPKIAVRGVGFDNNNIQAENGVTVYVDGVILQRTGAILGGFLDLAQVEVLKGPQGSAFGRNATGGSINLVTAKPEAGTSGEVSVGTGSFDRRNGGFVFNHGGDTFGVRLAASHASDDGYITNLVTGNDEIAAVDHTLARLSLSWNPSDAVSVDYALHYTDQSDDGPAFGYFNEAGAAAATGAVGAITGFFGGTLANPAAPLALAVNDDYDIVNKVDPKFTLESILHTLTAEFDLGWATLKSITGYMDFESRLRAGTPAPGNLVEGLGAVPFSNTDSEQYSQEFLLSGSTDRLRWVTGVYYLEEEAEDVDIVELGFLAIIPPEVPGGLPLGSYIENPGNRQDLTSYAVFADGQFTLTDRLRLNAGIRWTKDEKEASGQTRDTVIPAWNFVVPGVPFTSADKVEDKIVTWQTGLEFDVNDDLFTYVRLAKGYKAGGINSHNTAGPTFYEPEELLSFEAGIKGNLTEGLTFSLSAFTSEYEDIQLFVVPPRAGTADIINAAEATISGIDLDATWNATEALSFDAKATWLAEAEYEEFVDVIDGVSRDLSGEELNHSPEFTGVFGVNYSASLNDRVDINARAEVYAQSEVHYNHKHPFRNGGLTQDSYELVNLYLTATIDETVDVRVYGKNITDELYLDAGAEAFPFMSYCQSGRPEEYGIEVRYRF